MRLSTLFLFSCLLFAAPTLTGCGGHSEGVVETDPGAPEGGLQPQEQSDYEEYMKSQGGNRPGQ